jgi:WYL domain
MRHWRADRVVWIALGERLPVAERVFDVRSQLGRAWLETAMADWADDGPVRIKMTAAHVARLERDWYCGRARFDSEPDGTALMTYGEDNLQAVFSVLRWLGPGAELVAPAPLARRLRRRPHRHAHQLPSKSPPLQPEGEGGSEARGVG